MAVNFNKENVKNVMTEFENRNGAKLKDFNIKEITILFHKETHEKIEKIDKKLDKHIEWGQNEDTKLHKVLANHDKLFQKITNLLPEKGFCQTVTNTLELNKDVTLADKIDTMWHDRRWIKRLLAATLTAIVALGGGNLLLNIL